MKKIKKCISFRIFLSGMVLTVVIYIMGGCTSPLHRAIINENPVKVKEIIKQKDIEKIRQDKDSLTMAVEGGQIEIIGTLLEAGADVNALNRNGYTPLFVAVSNENVEIVDLLIKNGADVNKPSRMGITPLIVAFEKEYKEIQEMLITKEADVNVKSPEGWTPLMYTALSGDKEMTELLIKKGADVNTQIMNTERKYRRYFTRDTPLHIAIYNGNEDIVFLLVKSGANVNVKNRYLQPPLYFTVDMDDVQLTEFLIQSGAKPFILDRNADDVYVTAKIHKLIAMMKEKSGDIKKAIENYSIAAKYFEKASPMLLSESKKFRTRKFFSKLSNILQVLGVGLGAITVIKGDPDVVIDWDVDTIPSSRINELRGLQKEYKKRSEESSRSAMECRNILLYLNREKKGKK